MKQQMIAVALASALVIGCATTPAPEQQEALASIAIAAAIERTQDPQATAVLVLDVAAMPLSVDSVANEVKERVGYYSLIPSQQLAIDSILDELSRQIDDDLTTADKDATLALWRRAAIAAAGRFSNVTQADTGAK